ncbi:NAD-dependent epimerase/dehydratase family protein [Acidobacteria bacterium AH-259-G07]|nr:NAD-dependent epimerase/dehydratase family protein [Acidobacteria bacterium AH-259-G07]
MRALVTGGGGFLGGAVVRCLLEQGSSVGSFSRGSYPALEALGVEVFRGDLADAQAVAKACRDREIVFHVAAKAGIWGHYDEYYRVNVIGTKNVIAACRSLGIPRLVYTSSPSVVFDGGDMEGVDESVPYPHDYKAAYPTTKATAERMILAANDAHLATIALRPHLIWGPGDTHLVPGILALGRKGRLRKIGKIPRMVDVTYVDDAAEAHILAAHRLWPGSPISGRAFFISQGQPVALWDFVNRILQAAELPPATHTISPRAAYAAGWLCEILYKTLRLRAQPPMTRFLAEELATAHWFDITAARQDLGYEPKIGMEEGLRRLKVWLKEGRQSCPC